MQALRMTAARSAEGLLVTVVGDLDIATKPYFVAFLTDVVSDRDRRLSLDLSGLTFLGAEGLGALIALQARLRLADTALLLVGCTEQVLKLLRLTNLQATFVLG